MYFLERAEKLFHQRQGFSHGAVGATDGCSQRGTEHLIRKGKAEEFREALTQWRSCPADHFMTLENVVSRLIWDKDRGRKT